MFGGKDEDVLPAALALEVFHNFTLLHDDVMDRADVRRGRPTVHVRWNDNTAILSGDQMMIEAYELLAQLPNNKLPQVLRWFNQMGTEICEGQQYDVDFESRTDVSMDEYIEMIRLKTAVLLACSLKMGALAAHADSRDADLLYTVGENIGMAFQLQDDYLDLYGDPKTFGKAIGGDVACKKKTFLYILAHEVDDIRVKERLNLYYSSDDILLSDRLNLIRELYNKNLIPQRYEEHLHRYLRCADEALTAVNVSEEAKAPLRALIEKIAQRNN